MKLEKIEIWNESDLPKKEGSYYVHEKNRPEWDLDSYSFDKELSPIIWIDNIDWYLSPVKEMSDEEIEAAIRLRYNSGVIQFSGTVIRDMVTGAKFYRDRDKTV